MMRLTPFREALAREGVLRDVEVDGYRICAADLGKGRPVVLLHGLGGSIYDWRHLMKPLAEGRRVIAIDFLGAGESDKPVRADYSAAAQARRVRSVLDALGIGRASLAGNSLGGGVALKFAQDWPERVDRLVLINSICYADHVPFYVALCRMPGAGFVAERLTLGRMTRRVLRRSTQTVAQLSEEELETYVLEMRASGRRSAVVRVVRAIVPDDMREFEARLRSIRAPALLLWGAADETVPVELGRRLARELPDATLVELDAGHVPNQERPAEVLARMQEFLR